MFANVDETSLLLKYCDTTSSSHIIMELDMRTIMRGYETISFLVLQK